MRLKKHLKSAICLMLTVLLLLSAIVCVSAAQDEIAQTGAAKTVYFRNTGNWGTVNAYCWVKGTDNSVKAWPGESMTLVEGNVYKYVINGDYNSIIFNNGSTQTADLDVAGDGQIFDYSTNSWSAYDGHITTPTDEPTDAPTQKPTNAQPTVSPSPNGAKMVYCKNSAGWGKVNCYMWKDGAGENGSWPGKQMTNIGEDVWQYEVTGDFNKIIFNDGSTQTGDMDFPGAGYIYDNKTNKWEKYDTSPITVKTAGPFLASPQYKGTDITLSATATSTGGKVYYKFSVKNGSNTTVLSDFSTKNKVDWTPTTAGAYTLVFDFKDAAGNENQRTATYEIKDDSNAVEPVLKGVSPKPGEVKKGTAQTLKINAGGGKTGTNLLFYKVKITDPNGKTVNVPYYSKTASCKFTPATLGNYTVTVYVQASDNETVEREYTYECVDEVGGDDPDVPTPGSLKGDTDNDGYVGIVDATLVQRYVAQIITENDLNLANAEVDGQTGISIMDATFIQRYVAQIITW